jgi:protoheme IX farnesyltransferase
MKTAVTAPPPAAALIRARLADYLDMTKPGIALMVLVTVAAGFCLASTGSPDWLLLVHTLCGTALVAAGASVLNHWLERHSDALMRRTENRPLPAGRLFPGEAIAFGLTLAVSGFVYLALLVGQPLCVAVAAFTFVSYVWIYTPLKKYTTLNTLIGAVPGALPPVIGWTAASGSLSRGALLLFLILFLWQVPHFLAIAWIHRADYARAGLRMLPAADPTGRTTGRQMLLYCFCLLAVSLTPFLTGRSDLRYMLGATLTGSAFLFTTWRFLRAPSVPNARLVLKGSLLYLPVILALLLLFGFTEH